MTVPPEDPDATAAQPSAGPADPGATVAQPTPDFTRTQAGPPAPGDAPSLLGLRLDGRYLLHSLIGRGATAEVFAGTDEVLGRAVAIKVFHAHHDDPTTVARQRTEMQLLAGLNHPNLVAIYDARIAVPGALPTDTANVSDSTHSYLVMEMVQGPTLAARLTMGSLDPAEVRRIGVGMSEALALVHSKGLVHRDIKPANILTSVNGVSKLSDFGIARMLDSARLTATQDVIGTAAYLSPEQARGQEVGPPTDIYALGLVLLECLTGRREFQGAPLEAGIARLLRDPLIPAQLPAPWPVLITAMTRQDERLRPTARDVADVLTGRLPVERLGGPMAAPPPPPQYDRTLQFTLPPAALQPAAAPTPPPKKNRSAAWIAALAALAVVGVLIVVAALASRSNDTPSDTTNTSTGQSTATGPSSAPSTQPELPVTSASSAPSTPPSTTQSTPTTQTTTTTTTTVTTPPTTPSTATTPATTPTPPATTPAATTPATTGG